MYRRCRQCRRRFKVKDKRNKFCRTKCYWRWQRTNPNAGSFVSGLVPWNTGTKGLTSRNKTTFKKGQVPVNKQQIGDVVIRVRKRDHKERAWIKVSDKGNPYDWRLRAVVVWERKNGPMPLGYLIHHKDRNTLNDKLSNLELLTRAEHLLEHRPEFEPKRKKLCGKITRRRHARNRAARKSDSKTS